MFSPKRIFIIFLILLPHFFSAENMQIVFPKTLYTGDKVEIKYIFHSDADVFSSEAFEKNSAKLNLKTDYPFFEAQKDNFYLKEIYLEKLGAEYTLSIKAIVWKAGYLIIPPFDLTSLVRYSKGMIGNGTQFVVELKPILVSSLIEKNHDNRFRPQASPLVMPGTTAYLAAMGFFYLVLFFLIVTVLLKISAISKFLNRLSYILSLKKNSRKAVKKLNRLLKASGQINEDKDYAQELQLILREFLKKRFSKDFNAVSTNKLYEEFTELVGGDLSEGQDNGVELLTEVFFRTDYIRYSGNGSFEKDERQSLVQKCLKMIEIFDSDEEESSSSSDNGGSN